MHSSEFGVLAESRVVTELLKQAFHVFTQYGGKAPIDMIALKNNRTYRISVKSTSVQNKYGNYTIQLKKVRGVTKDKWRIINFDATECDVLAVYILTIDKVLFVPVSQVVAKTTMSFTTDKSQPNQNLIDKFLVMGE